MISRSRVAFALLLFAFAPHAMYAAGGVARSDTEYSRHFGALSTLSVAVAEAMPPEQYAFRPDPGSMSFGEVMSHIATTNYAFCAGLKDSAPPDTPVPSDKTAVVKFLSSSFEYCSAAISNLNDEQLSNLHNSPDGRMSGRDVLLALYVHVAHHRGQAEVYLRDKGITPPSYRV